MLNARIEFGIGHPIVLYELNEVPWKVIDWYAANNPTSHIAAIVNRSCRYCTITHDVGELHPWTTWPTLHRGVTNRIHNIRFINQNLEGADAFPPVWETLQRAGKRVGVFGSLQSYPPPSDDGYDFYVPDTFSPGCETLPPKYSAFQRFNLRQTQQDGAHASALKFDSSVSSDIYQMLRSGLTLSTCLKLATHITKERLNPLYRNRRSVLQALVAFDMFKDSFKNTKPDFCTFFTNHVAGMMHRYWKYTFPEDFDYELSSDEDRFHAGSISFAMDIADAQIAWLMKYVDSRGGRLMLATSMGQEAIDRGEYLGEWRITNVPLFLNGIGWTAPAQDLMAMQPDFNFALVSEAAADQFLQITGQLVDVQGVSIWKRTQRMGTTVNLGLAPSAVALSSGEMYLAVPNVPKVKLNIANLGIEFLKRDQGTGYHQPRGVLMLYGNGITPDDSRREIDLIEVRPMILDMMGIA